MNHAEYVDAIRADGGALATAAANAGVDASVPSCPLWTVADLLGHLGRIHRWVASGIVDRATDRDTHWSQAEPPPANERVEWFAAGVPILADALADAGPDVELWSWTPDTTSGFWARRQAHETTVHRVDAESARGGRPGEIAPDFAADGIDELLRGFHRRRKSRVRTDEPRVLRVRATDTDGAVWTVRLSQEPPAAERDGAGDTDCELAGPAGQLYLALWNRAPFPNVTGDAAVAALWRERSGVTWS